MSSARQAVILAPSFTGFGKRPSLMPAHQVDRLTGIGPVGARMALRRRKPVEGRLALKFVAEVWVINHRPNGDEAATSASLRGPGRSVGLTRS